MNKKCNHFHKKFIFACLIWNRKDREDRKENKALLLIISHDCTLKLGVTRHLATDIAEAVNGPVMPMFVRSSEMFGVSLNGTGRLQSSSPGKQELKDNYSH